MESPRNDPLAAIDEAFDASRIAHGVPPALIELQKAEERVLAAAIHKVDAGEMTPDLALQTLITLSVQRNLRRKLQKTAQMAESINPEARSAFDIA